MKAKYIIAVLLVCAAGLMLVCSTLVPSSPSGQQFGPQAVTATVTPCYTATATSTPTSTATTIVNSPTPSNTPTVTNTPTATGTPTPTGSATPTATETPTRTATPFPICIATATPGCLMSVRRDLTVTPGWTPVPWWGGAWGINC